MKFTCQRLPLSTENKRPRCIASWLFVNAQLILYFYKMHPNVQRGEHKRHNLKFLFSQYDSVAAMLLLINHCQQLEEFAKLKWQTGKSWDGIASQRQKKLSTVAVASAWCSIAILFHSPSRKKVNRDWLNNKTLICSRRLWKQIQDTTSSQKWQRHNY